MNVSPLHVYEIVVCGHTQELCFFLKNITEIQDPELFLDGGKSRKFSAETFALQYPRHAMIYTLPVISHDIGGDIAAGIFAAGINRGPATELFIHLGAVSTAVLSHEGKLSAISVSKTGVFECVGIALGMRPETGAVESVFMDNEVHISVIGESLPRGICGSGLMEGAAVLKRTGIIDDLGNFQDRHCLTSLSPSLQKRVINVEGEKAFLLFSDDGDFQTDIYITSQDLQLLRESKARISHMINSLMTQRGVSTQAISRVFVGGVFGHKIDTGVFFELGFLPSFLKGRVSFLGNTSKKGAEMALLDENIFREAEKIVENISVFPPFEGPLSENFFNFSSSF